MTSLYKPSITNNKLNRKAKMNISDKTAKCVTLAQLHRWLKDNNHITWNMNGAYGDGGFGVKTKECPDKSPIIKYIFPSLDMRTGTIYTLTTEGFGNYCVDFREEFDGTILDLLAHKIKNKETLKPGEDAYEHIRKVQIKRFNKGIEDASTSNDT